MMDVWTEKYRPKSLEDIVDHEHVVDRLEAFMEDKSMPHLLFTGPAGTGKCITGESPVVLANGEIVPIKEACERKVSKVKSLQEDGTISNAEVNYFYKSEKEKIFSVKTGSGAKVDTTPEHPFLVLREGIPKWEEAQNLREGDLVASTLCNVENIKERKVDLEWGKIQNLWAVSKNRREIEAWKLYSGVKPQVLKYLTINEEATNREIAKNPKNIKSVRWATRKLEDEGILTSKGERPKFYRLTENKISTKEVPYEFARGDTEKVFYKGDNQKKSGEIEYFDKVTRELAEWLGMVLGDGNVQHSRIRFYNDNKELRKKFVSLTREVFGDLSFEKKESRTVKYIVLKNGTVPRLLSEVFDVPLDEKKSHQIKIPSQIQRAGGRILAAFIRGYYHTDGYFSERGYIEISSASKEILSQIKTLLSFFGIITRLKRKEEQYYLTISGADNLKRFSEFVKPDIKKIEYSKKGNTNVDLIEVNTEWAREIMKNFGISYSDLGKKKKIDHILSADMASRKTVKGFYKKLLKISRKKINEALMAVEKLNNLNYGSQEELKRLFRSLNDVSTRRRIEGNTSVRYDRLKEYFDGERQPNERNLLKILKFISRARKSQGKEVSQTAIKLLNLRESVINVTNSLGISYEEISENLDYCGSEVNHYLNNQISLSSVNTVELIFKRVKKLIENKVLNESLIDKLEILKFLADSEVWWDTVESIEEKAGQPVYDLNIEGSHNFIGGQGLILHNTASSVAIAHDLFGDQWRNNVLELNASDTRGIDVIRNEVKDFARSKAVGDVPFKIIVLDEADALTPEAQQALRRTMENYTETCRFILICNYSSKIIDPIRSRCSIFRFPRLKKEDAVGLLEKISEREDVEYDDDGLETIYSITMGDLRKCINLLQSVSATKKKVTEDVVYDVSAKARPEYVKKILDLALDGKFTKARDKLQEILLEKGVAGRDIIKEMHRQLYGMDMPEEKKIRMIGEMGRYEFRIDEGADDQIQLEALLAQFASE